MFWVEDASKYAFLKSWLLCGSVAINLALADTNTLTHCQAIAHTLSDSECTTAWLGLTDMCATAAAGLRVVVDW